MSGINHSACAELARSKEIDLPISELIKIAISFAVQLINWASSLAAFDLARHQIVYINTFSIILTGTESMFTSAKTYKQGR